MVENPDPESLRVARMLADRIQTAGGMSLKVVETKKYVTLKNVILFTTTGSDATLGKEGYQHRFTDNVTIKAPAAKVYFWMQNSLQLLPARSKERCICGVKWSTGVRLPIRHVSDGVGCTWT